MLFSVYSLPNCILPLFGGIFVDKFGHRIGVFATCLIVFLGAHIVSISAYAHSFLGLLIGRFVIGIGGETLYMAVDAYAVVWFQKRQLAFALGVTHSSSRLGEIVQFVILPYVAAASGIEFGLFLSGCGCTLSLMACILMNFIDARVESSQLDPLRTNPKMPTVDENKQKRDTLPMGFWVLCVTLACFSCGFYTWIDYAPDFLHRAWGYNATAAGYLVAGSGLLSVLIAPVIGLVLDKYGKRLLAALFGNLILLAALFSMIYPDFPPYVWSMAIGVADATVQGAIYPCLELIVPPNRFGAAYGIAIVFSNVAMVPFCYALGAALDASESIHRAIMLQCLVAAFAVLATIIWIRVDESETNNICNQPEEEIIRRRKVKAAEIIV
eukprot:TRINITY_DN1626_c0_g1_i2.p1 TRINITY_DN1626_c0_g1~~TRINITY_DN1626_c0_g1_i2.p1  ORF type:complete len:383 (+),score=29.97 TRINITY_DN1626_c0_g1_i2:197-1345(+)